MRTCLRERHLSVKRSACPFFRIAHATLDFCTHADFFYGFAAGMVCPFSPAKSLADGIGYLQVQAYLQEQQDEEEDEDEDGQIEDGENGATQRGAKEAHSGDHAEGEEEQDTKCAHLHVCFHLFTPFVWEERRIETLEKARLHVSLPHIAGLSGKGSQLLAASSR